MSIFICPVCKKELDEEEKLFRCENGHCFDKSKFGYVNLLQSQKSSSKRHGDDRLMVRSRRDFLDSGYYSLLLDELCRVCGRYFPDAGRFLDAGCGECYYSSGLKSFYEKNGKELVLSGVDISKDALEFASKRRCGFSLAVASLFDLPFADGSFDAVLNIFSPDATDEFRRVLRDGGFLIRVIPLEKHLYGLKKVIYDKPYLNDVPDTSLDGFEFIGASEQKSVITIEDNEAITNLFRMTPYYYKTGVEDQKKIESLIYLETQTEFEIRVYRKV